MSAKSTHSVVAYESLIVGHEIPEIFFGEHRPGVRLLEFVVLCLLPIDRILYQMVFHTIGDQLFVIFGPHLWLVSVTTNGAPFLLPLIAIEFVTFEEDINKTIESNNCN